MFKFCLCVSDTILIDDKQYEDSTLHQFVLSFVVSRFLSRYYSTMVKDTSLSSLIFIFHVRGSFSGNLDWNGVSAENSSTVTAL